MIPIPKRITNANSTAQAVKDTPGQIFALNIVELSNSAIYVKFYNKKAADVNPASDVPQETIKIPASSDFVLRGEDLPFDFQTAISVRCVTGAADSDTTAPGTSPIIELEYY